MSTSKSISFRTPLAVGLVGAVGLQQILATANDPGDTKRDSIPLAAVSITAQTSAPVTTGIYITHAVTDDAYSAEPPRYTRIVFSKPGGPDDARRG